MKKNKRFYKFFSVFLGVSGLFLILSVLFPVFSYDTLRNTRTGKFISPVPEKDSTELDYTRASTWFPGSSDQSFKSSISFYNLSIPTLGIKDAVVSLGGEDLSDSLIQYPGTALPGKAGNTVVFGHSALPTFYNPHDYLTIFSTLPTIKKGDKILVVFDGILYTYQVSDMYEVMPTNLGVLNQPQDSRVLSLVTCVPPGDPRSPRRLIVHASLLPPAQTNYEDNRI